MLTLEGCSGGPPGVELRPECVLGVPPSGRKPPGNDPDPRASVEALSPPPRRRKVLAFEATRAVSSPETRMGPVHLGNVGSEELPPAQ